MTIAFSKYDADYWLESRGAIIAALEKAGFQLFSNAAGFWIEPAPALPVAWQETTADGEVLWDIASTPISFAYSRPLYATPRPLYANPVQATPAPADDVSVPSFETWLRSVCICAPPEDARELERCLRAWHEAARRALEGKT